MMSIANKSNEMEDVILKLSNVEGCESEGETPIPVRSEATVGEKRSQVEGNGTCKAAGKRKCAEKGQEFVPQVLTGSELAKVMESYQAVGRPSVVNTQSVHCWECQGCTGNNPPSAQRCLVEGCGVERPQVSAEVVRPGAEVDKPATVISEALLASKQKRCGNKKGNLKNGGRHRGSTNVLVALNQMKKLPNIEKFRSFWKLHKMVAQERTAEAQDGAGKKVQKAAQKCFFFTQSGTGMCPQLLAMDKVYGSVDKAQNGDGRCSKFCKECNKPFHEICTWEYHRAILKGFDADEWVREVWVREQAGVEVAAEHRSEDEEDED